jgi:hypothetical protein
MVCSSTVPTLFDSFLCLKYISYTQRFENLACSCLQITYHCTPGLYFFGSIKISGGGWNKTWDILNTRLVH